MHSKDHEINRKGYAFENDNSFYTAYEYSTLSSEDGTSYDYSSSDDEYAPVMRRNASASFQRAMSWKPSDYAPGRITHRDRNAWVPQRTQSSKQVPQRTQASAPQHAYLPMDREYSYDYYFSSYSSEEEENVVPTMISQRNQSGSFQRAISSKPKPSLPKVASRPSPPKQASKPAKPASKPTKQASKPAKPASKTKQSLPKQAATSASKKFQGPPAPPASNCPPGPQQGPQVHPDSFDSFEAAMKAAEDKARREKAEESSNVSRKLNSLVDSCRSDMARTFSKEHSIRQRKTFHKKRRTESKSRLFDRTNSVQAVVKAEHNAINGIMELAAKQSLRGKLARLIFGWRFFLPENEEFRENIRQNTPGFKGRSVSMIKGEEYL